MSHAQSNAEKKGGGGVTPWGRSNARWKVWILTRIVTQVLLLFERTAIVMKEGETLNRDAEAETSSHSGELSRASLGPAKLGRW